MSAVQNDSIATPESLLARLANSDTRLCLAVIVLLPNLLFLAVAPWLMVRRLLGPAFYLTAGALALLLPRAFAYPLFLLAAALDGFLIVSLTFEMPFDLAFTSMRFLTEIDVGASLLYSAGILGLFAMAIACAWLTNRYRHRLRKASFIPVVAAVIALIALDHATNRYQTGKPALFQSAMQQAGMTSDAIAANGRNVLLVLVEGMGAYADPRERDLLESKLRAVSGSRFTLTHGVNRHYGSTSGAMSRELCGKWGTFLSYMDGKPHDCLPSRLAKAGFETVSYDGFSSELFSLRDWYPRIGLQRLNFRDDMQRDHPAIVGRECGTAVRGLCDDDVGKVIRGDLAATGDKPKFVYWLTLNSHLPYTPLENGPLRCETPEAPIADKVPCELTEIWMRIFDTVAGIASDPAMPPLDIIVVGDHNTPMWSRAAASHFRPGLVDWYKLEYRAPAAEAAAVPARS